MALSDGQITFSPRLESSSLVWATGFAVMLVAIQALPAEWQRALWYDRGAIAAGEYWRILTGNLVHLGWISRDTGSTPWKLNRDRDLLLDLGKLCRKHFRTGISLL